MKYLLVALGFTLSMAASANSKLFLLCGTNPQISDAAKALNTDLKGLKFSERLVLTRLELSPAPKNSQQSTVCLTFEDAVPGGLGNLSIEVICTARPLVSDAAQSLSALLNELEFNDGMKSTGVVLSRAHSNGVQSNACIAIAASR